MKWKEVSKRLPTCFESGDWDGLRSNFVLVADKHGMYFIGRCYSGRMDGNEFDEWYTADDFEIDNVVLWMELPKLPNE